MEEYLHTLISGAVSFPTSWGRLGSGAELPRAVYFRMGGGRLMHMGGLGVMQSTVQIDCYGRSYSQAIGASRDIRAVLEGHKGGPILGAFLDVVRDANDDDAEILHRVSLTFSITYRD